MKAYRLFSVKFRSDDEPEINNDHSESLIMDRKSKHRIGLIGGPPTMLVNSLLTFCLFGFLVLGAFGAQNINSAEQLKLPDDTSAKGYSLLLGTDKDSLGKVPNFFNSYGKLGVNYDIDRGMPFIWCEVSPTQRFNKHQHCFRRRTQPVRDQERTVYAVLSVFRKGDPIYSDAWQSLFTT